MGGLIWLLVVTYIVVKSINNAKENSRAQTKPNAPRRQTPPPQPRTGQQPANGGMWSAGQYAQPQRPPAQKQQKKQQKRQQRSTQPQQYKHQYQQQENTILQKARAHTTAHFEEDLTTSVQPQASQREEPDTSQLMAQVNELIVKGYSGNLEFERDFLAEATDMLNRMYG